MHKIKVIHVVEDYSLRSGGLRSAIKGIIENVKDFDHEIVTFGKEPGDNVLVFSSINPWKYSKTFKKYLQLQEISNNTIFHIHGIWLYPHFIASKISYKRNIPYVITLHGMLEPFHLNKNRILKRLYLKYLGKRIISNAKVIHAITYIEKSNLIKILGSKDKFYVIPNLVFFNSDTISETPIVNEKYILFIGRLAEQKGVDLILESMSRLKDRSILLKIVGPVNKKDKGYYSKLQILVKKLRLTEQVQFLGMKTGVEKQELIRKAHFLLTPSRSEAIGIVNLEAAKLRTPVIASIESGLNLEWKKNGGFLVDPAVDKSLDMAIQSFWMMQTQERNKKGNKLYNFAKKYYSWEENSANWVQLYKSCLKKL